MVDYMLSNSTSLSSMGNSDPSMNMDCNVMMYMSMYWGSTCTFLFDSFTTNTTQEFVVALGLLYLFCMSFIFITSLRKYLIKPQKATNEDTHLTDSLVAARQKNNSRARMLLVLMYFIQTLYGVAIMLLWMTYNGYVILTMCFGLSSGYFFFESKHEQPREAEQLDSRGSSLKE